MKENMKMKPKKSKPVNRNSDSNDMKSEENRRKNRQTMAESGMKLSEENM